MTWQPTCEPRWVNYSAHTHYTIPSANGKVLQQKWVCHVNEAVTDEEWRDIPVEKEE